MFDVHKILESKGFVATGDMQGNGHIKAISTYLSKNRHGKEIPVSNYRTFKKITCHICGYKRLVIRTTKNENATICRSCHAREMGVRNRKANASKRSISRRVKI